MKNVNKNANHMLATYHDSYLVHKNIPKFSLNGQQPFTIEVEFAYLDCNHGSFYSQEGGFDLGFQNALPYFSHPVFGTLNTPSGIILGKSVCNFLAVVYDMNSLKLYINGFEMASIKTSKTGVENENDFYIGKEFNGYIRNVRVLSRALTDKEIISDIGTGMSDDNDCVFWTDFTGIGYKDRSKNNIGMWRTGTDADCVNVVNCTVLKRNGLYFRDSELDYDSAFSLTGKIYPDLSPGGDFCIYTLYGSDGVYFCLYATKKDNAYYLALDINGNILMSQTKLTGMIWTDLAVTIDLKNGTVCLYQDGTKCAEQKYGGLKKFAKAKALIGAKYYTQKPDYSDSFNGLLDYFAEFDRILPKEDVNAYADDQPYLYADGLSSLMHFGWGDAEDIFSDEPLKLLGAGRFAMVEGTNKITDPVGLNWFVPKNGDDYWNSLSEYDRWELKAKIDIIREIVEDLTGFPMKPDGNIDSYPPLTPGNEKAVKSMDPPDLFSDVNDDMRPRFRDAMRIGVNRDKALGNQLRDVPFEQMPATTGIKAFFINNLEIIFAIGLLTIFIAQVILILKCVQDDRPENERAGLRVKNLLWDHNGDPKIGSIHFHDNSTDKLSPKTMTFKPNSSFTIMGVFVPSKLNDVYMDVDVQNTGTKNYTGYITLKEEGNVIAQSNSFTLAPMCTLKVRLVINASNITDKGFSKKSGKYQIYNSNNVFMINCYYTYYTLLGVPILPWNNLQGEYDANNPGYVNTALLEACLSDLKIEAGKGASGEDLIKSVITRLNECRIFEYDRNDGGVHFVSDDKLLFKYLTFLQAVKTKTPKTLLNCIDCAIIVSSLCAMHGYDFPATYLISPFNGDEGYKCNKIQLITSDETPEWEYPNDEFFVFHMVNRSNERGFSSETKIYDACLKVDAERFPGKSEEETSKQPMQPLGMSACENDSPEVNVDPNTPYNNSVYRERLVRNKEDASFCYSSYRVKAFESVNEEEYLQTVKRTEKLLGGNDLISKLTLLDSMYGELEWSFLYDGKPMRMCNYAVSDQNPKQAAARAARLYNMPSKKDIGKSYPKAGCFAVSDTCYVLCKEGTVYKISGDCAKEVVDYIYRA